MKQIKKFYHLTGLCMFVTGCCAVCFGYFRMLDCVRTAQATGDLTVGQFARGLIVPHILVLAGIGCTVFGVILCARALFLRKRFEGRE